MSTYILFQIGCLECTNESKILNTYTSLEAAKAANPGVMVDGEDYEPKYSEIQNVIFKVDV